FLALATVLLARPGRARAGIGMLLAAGAALGVAAAYKLTLALTSLAIAGWYLARPERGRGRAREGLLLGAGFILPLLALAGWMAATGCLHDYLAIQDGFVRPYASLPAVIFRGGLRHALWHHARRQLLPVLLAAVGIAALRRRRARRTVSLALAWAGGA